jgi:hypothetical protein
MWRSASLVIAFSFLSSVASAQQCTTDARKVVDELYRHMLERGADSGSQNWQNKLQNGEMTVRQVVRAIATSQEHNERFVKLEAGEEAPYIRSVNRLYRHLLSRQPDPAGARTHAQTAQSQGINAVVDAIINSAEYNQQFGDWGVPGSGGVSFCPPASRSGSAATAPAPVAPNPNMNGRFRGMDRNNDGTVTQDEWQGNRQSFRTHDWNGDGILSGDELRPGRFRQGQTAEYEDFDRSDRFEFLDMNNNGRVEIYEWHASDAAFHQLDRNGDNYLSPAELAGENSGAVATSGSGNLVYVDADQRWTDTGIDVRAGQTVVFNAQGTVQLSQGANDTASPAGSNRRADNAPVRQAPAGGLVARVDNGNPVFVGATGTMRAATSGRLFLTVNDDYLGDNSGEYRVNITVRGR